LEFINFYRTPPCIARTLPSQDVYLSVRLSVHPSVRLSHAGIIFEMVQRIIRLFHYWVGTPF